jgi:hypothetical protein
VQPAIVTGRDRDGRDSSSELIRHKPESYYSETDRLGCVNQRRSVIMPVRHVATPSHPGPTDSRADSVGMPLLGSCLFSLGLVHAITGMNEQITVSIGHSLSKLPSCQMPVPYLRVHIARGWPACSAENGQRAVPSRENV